MNKRDFLTLADYTSEELNYLLELSEVIKKEPESFGSRLKGKVLAMVFEKPSTRTRVSFETGIYQLGGLGLYLSYKDLQLGRGETIGDTARTLSRYVQGIMARVFSHETLVELARHSTVPVINGLSDKFHPCQAIADLLTIKEKFQELRSLPIAYIGDGNNVAHSLMIGCSMLGMDVRVATPVGYAPLDEVVGICKSIGKGRVALFKDPVEAVRGAQVVYTDVWASMGQEGEREKRLRDFKGWTITSDLMVLAQSDAIFMHCLPAHRGEEVSSDVIESERSVVWDQAENRLHTQKALMVYLMGD